MTSGGSQASVESLDVVFFRERVEDLLESRLRSSELFDREISTIGRAHFLRESVKFADGLALSVLRLVDFDYEFVSNEFLDDGWSELKFVVEDDLGDADQGGEGLGEEW